MRQLRTSLLLIGALALGGCVFAPGGGDWDDDHPDAGRVEPTIGQELLDLDKAHQAGIINTAEYERAKDHILNGR